MVATAQTAPQIPQLELVQPARPPRFSDALLDEVRSGSLESLEPQQLLAWGLANFAPRMALSASFGSREGMVILDMLSRIDPAHTRVFAIDTGRLHQETYDLMDRVRDRYKVQIEVFFPEAARVQQLVREHGLNLFYESTDKRQLCCGVRKVEPLKRALAGLDAWITGLRPEHGPTRRNVRAVEIDAVHDGRIKLNPLVRWTRADVDAYVEQHRVPVHALHAKGFPSVGCMPCTRAVQPGEDERAGRWWWESPEQRECGIHTGYEEKGSGI